jgi:hypothetical protein
MKATYCGDSVVHIDLLHHLYCPSIRDKPVRETEKLVLQRGLVW